MFSHLQLTTRFSEPSAHIRRIRIELNFIQTAMQSRNRFNVWLQMLIAFRQRIQFFLILFAMLEKHDS